MAFLWIKENIELDVILVALRYGARVLGLNLFVIISNPTMVGMIISTGLPIMESGSIVGAQVQDLAYYTSLVENLTWMTNCYTSSNQLAAFAI